jgi:hypothetical protein
VANVWRPKRHDPPQVIVRCDVCGSVRDRITEEPSGDRPRLVPPCRRHGMAARSHDELMRMLRRHHRFDVDVGTLVLAADIRACFTESRRRGRPANLRVRNNGKPRTVTFEELRDLAG